MTNTAHEAVSVSVREVSPTTIGIRSMALYVVHFAALPALVGCLSGLAGLLLALILHSVQHLAFGYSIDAVISSESFLQGVTNASAARRVTVLLLCGVVAGFGWYGLAKFGRPLTSVSQAVNGRLTKMPFVETVIHGLLQMITVALGSPLGREVAPREWGAMLAQRVARIAKVSSGEARLLVACGSGAGLAAVYDVPIAGTVFVMEVLLKKFRPTIAVSAAISCFLAAWIARIELGEDLQYSIPSYSVDKSLMVWAILLGSPFGAAGFAFARWTSRCALNAPAGTDRIWKSLLAFGLVGVLSIGLPQLLGNGKGPAELAFSDHLPTGLAATLIAVKILCVSLVLRAGARGGLLTPGFSLGALLAVVVGGIFHPWLPVTSMGNLAILGASAFLSSSMAMPMTAILLAMEFTDAPGILLIPILLAVCGSTVARETLNRIVGRRSIPTAT